MALTAVAYGNDTFVAVGEKGTIVTSRDGVQWTVRSSGLTDVLGDVAFGNGTFVAVGGSVITSADGVDWSIQNSGVPLPIPIFCVTYGEGKYVALT